MILVADDDENLCQNLQDILSQKGYRVSVALDSTSAIEKVKTCAFDIMLLDMKLPPLNGLEVYLEIRQFCSSMVVVIITGFLTEIEKMVEMTRKAGAYAFLEKPIDINTLLSLLEQIENLKKEKII
jgi:two-component system response regulator PilR (NtrC family)